MRLLNWPIDRLRRSRGERCVEELEASRGVGGKRAALVIVRRVAERQVIVAASEEARESGIHHGMTLTQARALRADVEHADHEPLRDRRALEALARWLTRFSPVAALGSQEQAPAIFLDVTGSERLFGSIEKLVDQARAAMGALGIRARIAVAPTPGAAWALADAGEDGQVVALEEMIHALAPLPPTALRIDDELSTALHHLGITSIGQVVGLPRSALPARFGPWLLSRLDQALGRIAEPLTPLAHPAPVMARMEFDGVVSSLEAIWKVFQRLIDSIIAQLTSLGHGVRRLEIQLLRPHGRATCKSIFLSRPSRDPVNLFNLFRCAIEDSGLQVRGSAKVHARPRSKPRIPAFDPSVHDDGYIGMILTAPLHERVSEEQIALLGQEQYCGQLELDRLMERLRVGLGDESIVVPRQVESYLPEKAWEPLDHSKKQEQGHDSRKDRRASGKKISAAQVPVPGVEHSLQGHRPLHLFSMPSELRVMVSPSDDAEGKPVAFTHGHEVHRVMHAVGPERIAGPWWAGNDKTRDYFDVEDTTGRRFWLFRVRQTSRWYLHGLFG